MFYDIRLFPFLESIVSNVDAIAHEFELRKNEPFMADFVNAPLPELKSHTEHWIKESGIDAANTGYDARDGSWSSFPLYKKGFPIKWYDAENSFPVAFKHILNVPGVNFSSFFRLAPGSGTKEHAHKLSNLIFHLCLFDVEGDSVLSCDGEDKIIKKKGDYAIFDYSKPHSSFNYGKNDRINFAIDFSHPE